MRTSSLGLGNEDICEQRGKNCLRITSYGKRYQGEGGVLRSREETRVRRRALPPVEVAHNT